MWRLDDDRALVITADFITPLVDDPRTWGRIAAINSASDVYAMGGRPLLALNLVGWNTEELPTHLLDEVLAGADEAAVEGGWITVGGHTVDDPEPKFGLAMVGEVHPERLLTNSGLRDGDVLVLTKPLGVGIIATALKRDAAAAEVVEAAITSMLRSNAAASQAALAAGATGATDVTGFGLLGHLGKMAEASRVDAVLDTPGVPMLTGARELAAAGYVPGGTRRNLEWVRDRLVVDGVDEVTLLLLADAQTSGGLVFGVAPSGVDRTLTRLREAGDEAAVIGEARAGAGLLVLR